jgi:hypothetical protein
VRRPGGKRLHDRRGLRLGKILKWIVKKQDGWERMSTGLVWLNVG